MEQSQWTNLFQYLLNLQIIKVDLHSQNMFLSMKVLFVVLLLGLVLVSSLNAVSFILLNSNTMLNWYKIGFLMYSNALLVEHRVSSMVSVAVDNVAGFLLVDCVNFHPVDELQASRWGFGLRISKED